MNQFCHVIFCLYCCLLLTYQISMNCNHTAVVHKWNKGLQRVLWYLCACGINKSVGGHNQSTKSSNKCYSFCCYGYGIHKFKSWTPNILGWMIMSFLIDKNLFIIWICGWFWCLFLSWRWIILLSSIISLYFFFGVCS